jgi:hypothetical protein
MSDDDPISAAINKLLEDMEAAQKAKLAEITAAQRVGMLRSLVARARHGDADAVRRAEALAEQVPSFREEIDRVLAMAAASEAPPRRNALAEAAGQPLLPHRRQPLRERSGRPWPRSARPRRLSHAR